MRKTLAERFWAKVDKRGPDECWPWIPPSLNRNGYGLISVGDRNRLAHRLAYELANGPIPQGEGYHGTCVLHRCDTRKCCNPAHLFLGTNDDNMADMVAKGRQARGEKSGRSKLTAAQVIEIRRAPGVLREIAALYGTATSCISQIKSGKYWAHVISSETRPARRYRLRKLAA